MVRRNIQSKNNDVICISNGNRIRPERKEEIVMRSQKVEEPRLEKRTGMVYRQTSFLVGTRDLPFLPIMSPKVTGREIPPGKKVAPHPPEMNPKCHTSSSWSAGRV